MSRATLIALCGVALAAVLVVVGALRTMNNSREELERQFAQAELVRADEVARALEEDVNQIGDYLRFLGPLLSSTESLGDCTRELRVLLQVAGEIRGAMVFDEQRVPLLEVGRRDAAPLSEILHDGILAWLTRPGASAGPAIETSGRVVGDEEGWVRVFSFTSATRRRTAGARWSCWSTPRRSRGLPACTSARPTRARW